ncbi:hypothetical protein R3P38DRAFT_2801021 [Favolaschia claudopus]|uniref:Uncharacterized protein n=1 Tax=Favolaschia claudopus TaxID=2862362 RepID=A0AAV9ZVS2_9AGAR
MFQYRWKAFTPPASSSDRFADNLEPDATETKRRPGRPKGSKNKPKELPPPVRTPAKSSTVQKKHSQAGSNVPNVSQSNGTASFSSLARGLLRPRSPILTPVLTETANSSPDVRAVTPATSDPSSPPIPPPSSVATIPSLPPARSTLERARQIAGDPVR